MIAARDIVRRQQHLTHRQVMLGEEARVMREQHSLPDARRCLLGREILRAPGQPESGKPRRDRSAADENHFGSSRATRCDIRHDGGDSFLVYSTDLGGQ